MIRRILLIGTVLLFMALPLFAWGANVPATVYENGKDDNPVALAGVKVEVFGNAALKSLLFSGVTDGSGACLLENVPVGKDVAIRLTKAGYVQQYDVRSFGDDDVQDGVILWIGSEADVNGLYGSLGQAFDVTKGQVYLEISDDLTGEGIEGVQLAPSSGKAFDLGDGEYLIVNAVGSNVKIKIAKPGYAFDIESATIPLFAGAMTQYYVNVQSGGGLFQAGQVGVASITGMIRRVSDAVGISGVSVAFTFKKGGATAGPTVTTDQNGNYVSPPFPLVPGKITVTPHSNPWTTPVAVHGYKFKKAKRSVHAGGVANFMGKPLP